MHLCIFLILQSSEILTNLQNKQKVLTFTALHFLKKYKTRYRCYILILQNSQQFKEQKFEIL